MRKIVDASQLLDLAKNGFIKKGTKIISNDEDKFEYVFKGETFWDDRNEEMAVSELMYHRFEILSEEDEEIDIQSIEDLKYETIIEILGECDCWKGNELYCLKTFSKNDENLLKSNAENHKKINELLKAIKQLDKKIKEKE